MKKKSELYYKREKAFIHLDAIHIEIDELEDIFDECELGSEARVLFNYMSGLARRLRKEISNKLKEELKNAGT